MQPQKHLEVPHHRGPVISLPDPHRLPQQTSILKALQLFQSDPQHFSENSEDTAAARFLILYYCHRGGRRCYYRCTCHYEHRRSARGSLRSSPGFSGDTPAANSQTKAVCEPGRESLIEPTGPTCKCLSTYNAIITCIRRPLRTERPADLQGRQQQKHPEPFKALMTTAPLSAPTMVSLVGLPGSKGSPCLPPRLHQPAQEEVALS